MQIDIIRCLRALLSVIYYRLVKKTETTSSADNMAKAVNPARRGHYYKKTYQL